MIHLNTPVGRVAIDETIIAAVSEEREGGRVSCKVYVGNTLSDESGFNITNRYDDVLRIISEAADRNGGEA